MTPTFSFSSILCADSYEIWLGDINDPEVDNILEQVQQKTDEGLDGVWFPALRRDWRE